MVMIGCGIKLSNNFGTSVAKALDKLVATS
jgi:hypothetical protein